MYLIVVGKAITSADSEGLDKVKLFNILVSGQSLYDPQKDFPILTRSALRKSLLSAAQVVCSEGVVNIHSGCCQSGHRFGTCSCTSHRQDLLDELALKIIAREQAEQINQLLTPSLSARRPFSPSGRAPLNLVLKNLEAFQFIQQVEIRE